MKKQMGIPNHVKQTWQNTAKEQPYLMPGTCEYEEYQEDLKEHNPFKPDDEVHVALEEKNAEHVPEMRKKEVVPEPRQEGKNNYRRHIMKETQFREVKRQAIKQAKKTETLEDDKKAKRAMPKDLENLVYDNGVTQDDFLPKALRKYQ